MTGLPNWYDDPDGSGGERWWDGNGWTSHRRPKLPSVPSAGSYPAAGFAGFNQQGGRSYAYHQPSPQRAAPRSGIGRIWHQLPVWARVAGICGTVVCLVVIAVVILTESGKLNCREEAGPGSPPANMTAQGIDVDRHATVTVLTVHFAGDIPPPADMTGPGRSGDDIQFKISDGDNRAFASVSTDESGDYGFMSFVKPFTNTNNVASDANTYARKTDSRTIVISFDLAEFGINKDSIDPKVVITTNDFAAVPTTLSTGENFNDQICTR
jgi:hypothetical protein